MVNTTPEHLLKYGTTEGKIVPGTYFEASNYSMPIVDEIVNVIFSEPATIVFWADGTKTVVKTSPNDKFDKEKGILWAYYLKYTGITKTQAQKLIAKHCEDG